MAPLVSTHALSHPSLLDPIPATDIVDNDDHEYFDARPHSISHPDDSSTSSSPRNSYTIELSVSRIKLEQHSDLKLVFLFEWLRRSPSDAHFVLGDDMIFCAIHTSDTTNPLRIPYLPKSLIPLVLHLYHDHPLRGHSAIHRKLSRIRHKFWWPNMHIFLANHIASCT